MITTFSGTYFGQKLAVDMFIESRSEVEQARHYRAYMIQKSYANNIRFLKSSGSDDEVTNVQIALLTPIVINQAKQYNDNARLKPEYWLPIYESEFRSNLPFYYESYRSVSNAIQSSLNQYNRYARDAERPLERKINTEYRKVVSNYNRYVRRLGHAKITERIKNEIFKETGIRMSANWHPTKGRKEFADKLKGKYQGEVNKEKQKRIQSIYGVSIAINHLDSPLTSPAVIKKINEKIDIFASQKPIRLNLTKESFYRHFKDVVPNNLKEKYSKGYSDRDPELMEKVGRIFIVPFVALFFSAICIVLNVRSLVASLIKVFCFRNSSTNAFKCVDLALWLLVICAPLTLAKSMFVDTPYLNQQLEALPVVQKLALSYAGSSSVLIQSLVGNKYLSMF
ncbi:hypothetical protein ACPV51_20150 [Vibrio astriarenae]